MNNYCKITPIFAFAVLFSIGPGTSIAQDESQTPTPPYVAAVPDFCAWTMTITAKESTDQAKQPAAPAPAQGGKTPPQPLTVLKVVSIKTKEIKRDVIYYSNGNSSEVWYDKNYVIVQSPNGEFEVFMAASMDAARLVSDMSSAGFIGVDWITARNFQTKKKLENGQYAYVYRGASTSSGPQPPPEPVFDENGKLISATVHPEVRIPMEAMIAVDTRLPIVVEKDSKILTYSFQSPPTEMLELPAKFQKEITLIEQRASFIQKLRDLQRR